MSDEMKKKLEETESEMVIIKPKLTCIVHKGPITGNIYVCPKCDTFYCQRCAKTLKKKGETCWVCKNKFKI